MTPINKQKFLAELGKLLTFMYEEDRQRAMELYARMFEDAPDEIALIQQLISPTRQAVVVARAYNANIGKLSVRSAAAPEDRDENGIPDYVQAIEDVRAQAWAAMSLPTSEPDVEEPAEEPAEEPVEEPIEEPAGEPIEEPAGEPTEEPAGEPTEEPIEEPAEEPAEVPAEESVEEPAEESAEEPVEEPVEESAEEPRSVEPEEAPKEEKKAGDQGFEFFTLPDKEEGAEDEPVEGGFNVQSGAVAKTIRKPKVFLLIVYILLAIPVTLGAIAVLLVPALLFLAVSVAAIICGVVLVSTAFKGFAVFADIMVLLGLALVLFALGVLFLWTAIWFVGGAIVGVVHGVAALCDKWCYKEVTAE